MNENFQTIFFLSTMSQSQTLYPSKDASTNTLRTQSITLGAQAHKYAKYESI